MPPFSPRSHWETQLDEPFAPEALAWLAGALGEEPVEPNMQRLAEVAARLSGALGAGLVLVPGREAAAICAAAMLEPAADPLPDLGELSRPLLDPDRLRLEAPGALAGCQRVELRPGCLLLGVPVGLPGGARGALWLAYAPDRQPDAEHYPWLRLLAAGALGRAYAAQLVLDRAERVARLNRLIATIKQIAQSVELAEILPEIVKDASQLLNASSGDIVLWNPERQRLQVVAVYCFPPDMLTFEMPLGEGLSSQAMASRRPVMVPDYMAYPHRLKDLDRYQFKAVLSVPLISRGEAIGAINVHSDRVGYRYTQDDISLLAAFADHAAVAIDNAQRYQSEKRMVADLRRLNDRLSQALALQQQFTLQALHGRGLAGLAERLAAVIGRPVIIEDPFFRLLAAAGPEGQPAPEQGTPPELQREAGFKAQTAQLALAHRPALVASRPPRMVAPLMAADDMLGYLTVLPGEAPLSELDQVAVELAATNCTLELLKQRAALEAETRLRGDFVLDLVSGNFRDLDSLLARAAFLGHNLNHPFEVVLLDIDDFTRLARSVSEREVVRLKQQVFETVRRMLAARSPQSLVAAQSDALIGLLSRAPAGEGGLGHVKTLDLVQSIRRELATAFPGLSLSAAIGEVCRTPADFQRAYEATRAALDLMQSLGKTDEVVDTQALGFYGLLLQANAKDKLAEYARSQLQPLRDYDLKHRTALLSTLQLYFRHGTHKQRAARAAFLHVNTLTYRLRKAQEVLGVDLRHPDDLLRLQFAFKVLETLPVWD